jgi:hypothetical protein
MTLEQRIVAFSRLGDHLRQMSTEGFDSLSESARLENPWFTNENIRKALDGVMLFLEEDKLRKWSSSYVFDTTNPKTVALVMAGNIPLVGFHDFLCVLISGHKAQIKLSSKDSKLLLYLIKHLIWLEKEFEVCIDIKEGKLENFDAVIATGSDNSARYFQQYFEKYPHIIRKNRTSVAILTGEESVEDFKSLGTDVFSYFGLGCRNVSKLYVPTGYTFIKLLDNWQSFQEIIHHHKYCNNYDYQKSIVLVNKVPFLDNGFVLLQENDKLVSPISVLYYEFYSSDEDLRKKLKNHEEKIQCIVGDGTLSTIPFGKTQSPELWDFADKIDTLKFLEELY